MNVSVNANQFQRVYPQQITPRMYQLHLLSLTTENSMFMNFESPEHAIEFLDQAKREIEKDLERGEKHDKMRIHDMERVATL